MSTNFVFSPNTVTAVEDDHDIPPVIIRPPVDITSSPTSLSNSSFDVTPSFQLNMIRQSDMNISPIPLPRSIYDATSPPQLLDSIPASPPLIATPDLRTPVDRSTRRLIHIPRIRRNLRRQRGYSSLLPSTLTPVPRSRTINKKVSDTKTAIEYDPDERTVGKIINECFKTEENIESIIIPTQSTIETRIREINRLEVVEATIRTLENSEAGLYDLQKSLNLVSRQIDILVDELITINNVIKDLEQEEYNEKFLLIDKINEL